MINVYDLKQYVYCPRVIYWYYCAPVKFHETYKMQWGAEKHKEEKSKEIRRKFERYGLEHAQEYYEYPIDNGILSGKLDLLLISENKYVPIEYKFTSSSKNFGHKAQLYGYALILSDVYNTKIDKGYLYYPRQKEIVELPIKDSHFKKVREIIKSINQIIEEAYLPDVESKENKCYSCEFQLFCNDTV